MNRREAVQRVAMLMGGVLSTPALLGEWNACFAAATAKSSPAVLTPAQLELVGAVVDIIIPRTNTPGAKDVGVPMLIDSLLENVYSPEDRARYLAGLAEFDGAAITRQGAPFLALDEQRRSALVREFHDAAVAEEVRRDEVDDEPLKRPFILMTKELTLLGFFTSVPGATEVLQYAAIPGAYHGCLSVSDAGNGHTWAGTPGLRF